VPGGDVALPLQGHRGRPPLCGQSWGPPGVSTYCIYQGVTKRCRLSLLTNSALVIRVQMRGEGGSCGVSANENSWSHHVTWSPNKLWRSTSIFNLWYLLLWEAQEPKVVVLMQK
jgi:hypothetical protein